MDEIDVTQDRMDKEILLARKIYAKDVPKGVAGECIECEEESTRLINGECARCRERMKKYRAINGNPT